MPSKSRAGSGKTIASRTKRTAKKKPRAKKHTPITGSLDAAWQQWSPHEDVRYQLARLEQYAVKGLTKRGLQATRGRKIFVFGVPDSDVHEHDYDKAELLRIADEVLPSTKEVADLDDDERAAHIARRLHKPGGMLDSFASGGAHWPVLMAEVVELVQFVPDPVAADWLKRQFASEIRRTRTASEREVFEARNDVLRKKADELRRNGTPEHKIVRQLTELVEAGKLKFQDPITKQTRTIALGEKQTGRAIGKRK